MLQYRKDLKDDVKHGGAGGSTAETPSILIKKYASGHMEKGLNGAEFQLFEYKNASYTRGDSNTEADWTPVTLPKRDNALAVFTTHTLESHGDGYAEIELGQDKDGVTLKTGKAYGLREIKTPVGTAANGDRINYQNPHSENFYCYVFSICEAGATADYNNFVFLQDDVMTIRNTPESVSLNVRKLLSGNCALSDAEKQGLTYQVFRKEVPAEGQDAVYMPIMAKSEGGASPVLDERFAGIKYDNVSGGWDINGLTAGDYLLAEYGNDTIKNAHLDWNWRGVYEWSDGRAGSTATRTITKCRAISPIPAVP